MSAGAFEAINTAIDIVNGGVTAYNLAHGIKTSLSDKLSEWHTDLPETPSTKKAKPTEDSWFDSFVEALDHKLFDHQLSTNMGSTKQVRNRKRKTKRKRGKARRSSKKLSLKYTPFPKAPLLKLRATHRVAINPAGSSQVGYIDIRPGKLGSSGFFGSGVGATIKEEHHPLWWSKLETLYGRYQPISCRTTATFMAENATKHMCYGIGVASSTNGPDFKSVMDDVTSFEELKVRYPRNIVQKFVANSSGGSNANVLRLSKAFNFKS